MHVDSGESNVLYCWYLVCLDRRRFCKTRVEERGRVLREALVMEVKL